MERVEPGLFLRKPIRDPESLLWPSASRGGRGSGPKPEEKLARKDRCFSSPLRVGITGGCRPAKFTAVGSFHCELDQEAVFFRFRFQARAVGFTELQGRVCEKCKAFAP